MKLCAVPRRDFESVATIHICEAVVVQVLLILNF